MNHKDTHDLNNGMVTWPKDADTSPKDQKTPVFEPTYTHVTYPLGDVQVTDEARECLKRSLEQTQIAIDPGNDDSNVMYTISYDEVLNYPKINIISSSISVEETFKEAQERAARELTDICDKPKTYYGLAELKPEGGPNELLMDYIKRNPAKPSESMPSTIKGDE
tara:strand:- start:785 stop:1279 length:495 start_codon:yes stop_codon:yes gene_type:complete